MLAGPPYAFTTRVTNDVATCNLKALHDDSPTGHMFTVIYSFCGALQPCCRQAHCSHHYYCGLIVLLVYLCFSPWSLTCQVLCILFSTSCFSYY